MLWLVLSAILAILGYYYLIWPLNSFTRRGVKQSKPIPLFGDQWKTILVRQTSIAGLVQSLYNLHPNARYMGFYDFKKPTLMIRDPDLLKEVTVKDFDHFTDHRAFFDPKVDPLWAANLFSLHGNQWKLMRATLSGSFTSSKMKHMFEVINETAERFVNHFLEQKQPLIECEMKSTYTRFTNDVIATSAFGIKVDSLKDPNNTFYQMGARLTGFQGLKAIMNFVFFLIVPSLAKLLKVTIFDRTATNFFKTIIYETLRTREEKGIIRHDMINLLMEARKGNSTEEKGVVETGFSTVKESEYIEKLKSKDIVKLTDDDIVAQALIFFFAGFDTVSTGLSFGTYELAVNKEIQDKLRAEIVATHKKNGGQLTYDSLLGMKYMDMVFSEILRKWAPTVTMDRVCTKPYTIEPKYPDEKPVHIKVGDYIQLPIHAIHNDPKYFPNPEIMDPERFSDENKGSIQPFTYNPFGYGPRSCIGSRYAILESKALFYNLLLNFEIVTTKKTPIPLVLDRKGLQLTAEAGFWLGLKRIEI